MYILPKPPQLNFHFCLSKFLPAKDVLYFVTVAKDNYVSQLRQSLSLETVTTWSYWLSKIYYLGQKNQSNRFAPPGYLGVPRDSPRIPRIGVDLGDQSGESSLAVIGSLGIDGYFGMFDCTNNGH